MALYSNHPGLQLYTLREQFAADPSVTLRKIATIGYKEIELFDPSMLTRTQEIRDLGMNVVGTLFFPGYISGLWNEATQFGIPAPKDTIDDIIDACAKQKVKNMGIMVLFPEERKTLDDYKRFAEKANAVGEIAKNADVQLYYHNHSYEFEPVNGTTPYEEMLKIFDQDLVNLELDVFWAAISGNDPTNLIKKLGSRIKFLHLKDLAGGTPIDFTTFQVGKEAFLPVGSGILDFKNILEAARSANVTYTLVEQDHSAIDPFESITLSYIYLQQLGL